MNPDIDKSKMVPCINYYSLKDDILKIQLLLGHPQKQGLTVSYIQDSCRLSKRYQTVKTVWCVKTTADSCRLSGDSWRLSRDSCRLSRDSCRLSRDICRLSRNFRQLHTIALQTFLLLPVQWNGNWRRKWVATWPRLAFQAKAMVEIKHTDNPWPSCMCVIQE